MCGLDSIRYQVSPVLGSGPALTICNILAAGDPPDPSDPRPFTAVMQSDPARNTAALTYSLLESFSELALAWLDWYI